MNILLDIKNLTMDFGGVRALNKLDLRILKGEIAALIGPNGAGKTTFFNCITGIYTPSVGDIHIANDRKGTIRINGMKPHQITRLGLARTFQNIRLFQNMTALENVMIGHHSRTRSGIIGALFRGKKTTSEEQKTIDESYALLKQIGLHDKMNVLAKNLSYGDQRRLEIGRAHV
jgi:branched-chain amino acid transport system ATP-binding protein